ncbi:MAG: hypothetical protein QM817_18300 [Archangium sp.]
MGHFEIGIGRERLQLAHARQIVIARDQHHLLGRMRREPAQQTKTIGGGLRALLGFSPVEVVAHRDQLHVVAQPPIGAEEPMPLEDRDERLERRLRISDGDVALQIRSPRCCR